MSTNNTSEPWIWCTNCGHHAAPDAPAALCPVGRDDQAHGITITLDTCQDEQPQAAGDGNTNNSAPNTKPASTPANTSTAGAAAGPSHPACHGTSATTTPTQPTPDTADPNTDTNATAQQAATVEQDSSKASATARRKWLRERLAGISELIGGRS